MRYLPFCLFMLWFGFGNLNHSFGQARVELEKINENLESRITAKNFEDSPELDRLFEQADRLCKEVVLRDSIHSKSYALRGKILIEQVKRGQVYADSVINLLNPYIEQPYPDNRWVGRILYYLGTAYVFAGQYVEAVGVLRFSIPILERNHDNNLDNAYNNLASSYRELDQYRKAKRYYLKCAAIRHNKKDSQISGVYNNLSVVNLNMELIDSAQYYINLAQPINQDSNTWHNLETSQGRIYEYRGVESGNILFFDSALQCHYRALDIRKKKSTRDLLNSYINIGRNLTYAGYYDEAIETINYALNLELGIFDQVQLKQIHAQALYEQYRLSRAIDTLDTLITSINSFNYSQGSIIVGPGTIIEIYDQLEIYKATYQKILVLIGSAIIIIAILLISILVFFREKYKRAQIQQEKLNIINEHATQLALQHSSIVDTVFKKIALELHDKIGNFLSLWKLGLDEKKHNDTLNKLDELHEIIRSIARNLHPPSLPYGLMPSLRELQGQLNQTNSFRLNLYSTGIEQRRFASQVESNIYRIVQEALSNVINYAKAKSVDIQLIHFVEEEYINLTIIDDGQGFNMDKTGRGLGLTGMQSRAEGLGGTFSIDSHQGSGTTIMVNIPAEIKDIES